MALNFWKLTGAGNDFVVINNMSGEIPEGASRAKLVRTLCARRIGVGADGLLLTEPAGDGADFRMRYYNADGGEAETCGNGARCIARFAHLQGIAPEQMRFETQAGVYDALVRPDAVRVSMSDAHSLQCGISLDIPNVFTGEVDFANTGVPHVVAMVSDIEQTRVCEIGAAIRYHERFAPAGTNVNFVAPAADANHLLVRTYERGVEDETLACGTGSIASAIIACLKGFADPPVRVSTRSGVDLVIGFEPTDSGARRVTLEGEARVVYRGEMDTA